MATSRGTDKVTRRAFERACAMYEELATNLTAVLMRLRSREAEAGPLEPDELEIIRSHQKTVLMVMDFEARLLRKNIGGRAAAGRRLDLAAARAEIARRLDLLAAAHGA